MDVRWKFEINLKGKKIIEKCTFNTANMQNMHYSAFAIKLFLEEIMITIKNSSNNIIMCVSILCYEHT